MPKVIEINKPYPKVIEVNRPSPKVVSVNQPSPSASLGGFGKQVGIGFGNEALMGLPLYSLKKVKGENAVKALESNIPVERFGRGLGTTIGLAIGIPKLAFTGGVKAVSAVGKLALGAEKASKVNRFVKSAAKAGAGAGAYEAIHAPEESYKEKVITVPTSALFGATVGVAGESVSPYIQKFLEQRKLINKGKIGGTKELDKLNQVLDVKEQEPVKMKVKQFGQMAETQLYDRFSPLRHLQESAQEFSGKNLNFSEKPYEAARLYSGVAGKISNRFQNLANIVKPQREYIKPIEQIFTAERLLERADKGFKNPGGVTSDEARKMLLDIEQAVGKEQYQKLTQVTNSVRREFTDKILTDLVDSGVMSSESKAKILSENQFYAPFQVVEYVNKNIDKVAKGVNAFSVREPGFLKSVQGTEKDINSPLDALMNYTVNATQLAEKNRVLNKLVNLRHSSKEMAEMIRPIEFGESVPHGFDKISLFRNGVKESYAVPSDISDVVKGLNNESIDLITKTASYASRALRAGATQLNLAFVFPNMIRDYQTAKIVSKVGFSVSDWVKGFGYALRKGDMYQRFLQSGGSFGGYMTHARRTIPGSAKELLGSPLSKANEILNPVKWINKVGEISEQSTRLGVFARGLRNGLTMEESAFNARNSTVDFAKVGTKMKIANLWVPFLNARTQGIGNFFSALKSNPKRFALNASAIVGTPLTLTYAWNTTQYPDVWDDIPQFEKDNYFIFIGGRQKAEENGKEKYVNVYKIPKGDVGKIVGNPLESFYEYLRGKDPEYSKIAMGLLDSISPIGASTGSVLSTIIPPPVKAAAEGFSNKNFFTGRQIVPEAIKGASPRQQYTETTSPIAIQIGDIINVSPMKIENAMGTLFGGVGRQLIDPLQATNTLKRRFVGASANAEQDSQFEVLEQILQDSGDKSASDYRLVRQSLIDFDSVPPDKNLRARFFADRFKGNRRAAEKFVELYMSKQSGDIPIFKALRNIKVEDRIKFLREYSQGLSEEERILFLKSAWENKVVTPDSFKKFKE